MKFTEEDYKSLYRREEKRLIIKALVKTKGLLKKAYPLLCPMPHPMYSYNALVKVVGKHQINVKQYRV